MQIIQSLHKLQSFEYETKYAIGLFWPFLFAQVSGAQSKHRSYFRGITITNHMFCFAFGWQMCGNFTTAILSTTIYQSFAFVRKSRTN